MKPSGSTSLALKGAEFDRLGALAGAIGAPEFDRVYQDVFRALIGIDDCTVFAFSGGGSPRAVIVQSVREDWRQVARGLAADYVSGGYRHDPNIREPETDANIFVRDVSDFQDEAYRQHYFENASLARELVVLGNKGGTLYYASFYKRRGRGPFSPHAIDTMRHLGGFILQTLHRHCELTRARPAAESLTPGANIRVREQTLQHLRDVLLAPPHHLSRREADVCARIIMGYSSLAIALNLSISVHTVATHRKRAYAKMGISSQNELFIHYFGAVGAASEPAAAPALA